MGLFSDLRALLSGPPPLRMITPKALPPGITLRQFRAEDRSACLAIYAENEPGRFPRGFIGEFGDFLDRPDYLRLVLSQGESVVAVGGVGLIPFFRWHHAWLVFGMVTRRLHGKGLGTALLLARICAIPEPRRPIKLIMANVAGAQDYYARFGFAHQGQMRTSRADISSDVRDCQQHLATLGLSLGGACASDVDVWRQPPNNALERARDG